MTENLPENVAADGVYRLMPGTSEEVALPLPIMLATLVRGHVEADVANMRALIEQRGGITSSADVFNILRYLGATDEMLGEYIRLIKDVREKTIKPLTEEVLADGVGADAQGNPVSGLTVPDQAGDIRITRKSKNVHTITPEQVLPAFASMFADQHVDAVIGKYREHDGEHACCASHPLDDTSHRATVGVALAEAILDALNNVGELGKFEPQVSKVRAYSDHLARNGQDAAAGIVKAAISTTREYDGIGVERKH